MAREPAADRRRVDRCHRRSRLPDDQPGHRGGAGHGRRRRARGRRGCGGCGPPGLRHHRLDSRPRLPVALSASTARGTHCPHRGDAVHNGGRGGRTDHAHPGRTAARGPGGDGSLARRSARLLRLDRGPGRGRVGVRLAPALDRTGGGRGGGRHHSLQLPHPDQPGQAGPRAGRWLHGGAQGGARHAVVGAGAGTADLPTYRHPCGGGERPVVVGRSGGRGSDNPRRCRHDQLHRFHRRRATGDGRGVGHRQAGVPRVGRQERLRGARRRGRGHRGVDGRSHGVHPRRSGLRHHHPPGGAGCHARRCRGRGRRDAGRHALRRPGRRVASDGAADKRAAAGQGRGPGGHGAVRGGVVGAGRAPAGAPATGLLLRAHGAGRRG